MKKSKKRILAGSVAAAGIAGAAALSHAVTDYLMRAALDREAPESLKRHHKKLSGVKGNRPFMDVLAEAARKLEARGLETVDIRAADGTRLVGHWWPCEHPRRVIVAMHGWRSTWAKDFGLIADFWHREGCSILFAEQRGQGASGGACMGFGLIERFDCLDWIRWVNGRTAGALPIYLGGVSMGATTVLMASASELPQNVAGIIADCGFTSPEAIWRHVVRDNLHLSYRLRRAAVNGHCLRRLRVGADSYSTTEALKKTAVPVLFIHGSDDHFVPVEMTYENYKACASEKHLLIVPGAGHAGSYPTDPAAYERALRVFWER